MNLPYMLIGIIAGVIFPSIFKALGLGHLIFPASFGGIGLGVLFMLGLHRNWLVLCVLMGGCLLIAFAVTLTFQPNFVVILLTWVGICCLTMETYRLFTTK